MKTKQKLQLAFYGDDFTGSTDALEQLTQAGVRTVLFVTPPTAAQIARFKGLQALGVAGMTRSMKPEAMARELRSAFKALKSLDVRHVHYKVCSTFDSSPTIGSIGRAIDVGAEVFRREFVPVLAAAPALGRYTIFGTHFARYGIGSAGKIHRLDQHPSISKHPVTPMREADLCLHLAKQTQQRIGLFDILHVALPKAEALAGLRALLKEERRVIFFDAVSEADICRIGRLLEVQAAKRRPLFSVGSSAIERALTASWPRRMARVRRATAVKQLLVGSGSCSPVTSGQIAWALKRGFREVALDAVRLASTKNRASEIRCAAAATRALLEQGRSVIVHSTRSGSDRRVAATLRNKTARILGGALGEVLRAALVQSDVKRLCIAGGDTSSYAARALGIEALEMIAPLTPGAPLCRAMAPSSPIDGLEVVFKGGQVGSEDYFEIVRKGKR